MNEQICFSDGDPTTAEFMLIGESPNKDDKRAGRGFAGASGRLLWKVGAKAGFTRDKTYITNVSQAWPASKSGQPSQKQIQEGWERLDEEILSFQGKILVVVGGIALRRVTGLTNITQWRGYCIRPSDCRPVMQRVRMQQGEYKTSKKCLDCHGTGEIGLLTDYGILPSGTCPYCAGNKWKYHKGDPKFVVRRIAAPPKLPPNIKWIIPIFNPMGVIRARMVTLPMLAADVRRAARLSRDDSGVIEAPIEGVVSCSPRRVTIDIETPYESWAIDRVGVAATSLMTFATTSAWTHEAKESLIGIMADQGIEKSFHNAAFDVPRLEAAGCPLKGEIFDTMWAAQFLRPDLPKGLAKVAPLYLDVIPWKHLNEEQPEFYNLMDAYVQHRLADELEARLNATKMMKPFRRFMKCLPSLMRMTQRGIKVDPRRRDEWVAEQEEQLVEAAAQWPWPEVNYNSPKQLQELFYGKLRLPVQYSKHGDATTDETALRALKNLCTRRVPQEWGVEYQVWEKVDDGIQALLSLRELQRNIKYYGGVEPDEDGCIHPEYLPKDKEESLGGGSKTGRIQPRNPNIANQHIEARKLYVPHNPNHKFVAVDWSQAEAWIEQALSGDEALATALRGDLHGANMKAMKVDRVRAKNVWYGTGRLASARTLCITLRKEGFQTTVKECKEMQDKLYQAYPDWAQWRLDTIAAAESLGYVEEPLGRRYYLFGRGNGPVIVGYKPQAGVGSMLQEVIPEIDAAAESFGGCLTLTMHDEAMTEIPNGKEKEAGAEIRSIMEREWDMIAPGFRLKTDLEIGEIAESWGCMNARHKS